MSWQNQTGQQFPNQPGSPFPGQTGQPFSGIPGYSGQQAVFQIPPAIIAAAQAAGLGMPTREFRRNSNGNNPITSSINSTRKSVNSSMNFSLIITVGILLVVGVIILFTIPTPENWYTAGGLILIGLFTAVTMGFGKRLTNNIIGNVSSGIATGLGGNASEPLIAWGCPDGLVYKTDGQISTVRWDNLNQVWRKVGMLNGTLTTLAYIVQPDGAPQFSFSLLTGPFANMAFGGNASGSTSISFGGGEVSNNGGFTQISGNFSLSEYAGLGDLVEEQMLQRTLPRMIETYRAGGTLVFGTFMVRQQGLSDGARELAWAEIDRVQISEPAIQITKKPASMVRFNLSAVNTPNMALLAAVLNTIQGGNA